LQRPFNPEIAAAETLTPGEIIVISYANEEQGENISVIGYTNPFIDQAVLRRTLPYLTYLSIYAYGFTPRGDIVPIDDEGLIAAANEFGAEPVMMLAPITAEGGYNSNIAHDILINDEAQTNLVNNILANITVKGYRGLDINFDNLLPQDRQNFINFITKVKDALSPEGIHTFVTLPAKTAEDMPGNLFEAYDYNAIGAIADYVFLVTYGWGYFGPPMATAPINEVRRVLEYGISSIDPDKILMGIPNYAYDWPLPFAEGETQVELISNQEAIMRAANYGATIQVDEEALTSYFNYTAAEGIEHVVWFDDVASIDQKIRLIPELGIHGAGVWQIMNYYPDIWNAVDSLFMINKSI
jgi:spore germination protein